MSFRLACCVLALGFSAALDMKWTPNGEAPAPFSTKQREAMGMDPSAMAGGQPGQPEEPTGGTLTLGLGALLVVYVTNNWLLVQPLVNVLQGLLGPLLGAAAAPKPARKAVSAKDAQKARAARLSRLAVDTKK